MHPGKTLSAGARQECCASQNAMQTLSLRYHDSSSKSLAWGYAGGANLSRQESSLWQGTTLWCPIHCFSQLQQGSLQIPFTCSQRHPCSLMIERPLGP